MSDLAAWVISFRFSTGDMVALNVAPTEASSVAFGLRSILMSEPKLLDPAVVLESVTVLPIPQEQLSLLLRTVQGERPVAEVVQLVPKPSERGGFGEVVDRSNPAHHREGYDSSGNKLTFEQKMRGDLFVMCGLHGRQEGAHCQPCREAMVRNEPHTFLAFDPQGGAA